MTNQTFIALATAFSAAISSALAGITLLPIEDLYKAIAVFALSIVGTFLSALLKPPIGPQVPKDTSPAP